MRITFENFVKVKYLFAILALIIVAISTYFTNGLVKNVAMEEERKMTLWAEATRKVASAEEMTDFDFLLKVIEDNTTIPCFILDQNSNVVGSRNISVPKSLEGERLKIFWQERKENFGDLHDPIAIDIDRDTRQYIYYDNSLLLKRLSYYPYIQWGVILIFFLAVLFFFTLAKRAEQDKVWAGLSKETAHQLGTPISSLMAWVEYMKMENIAPELIPEMEKDVTRLQTIADRFSKVGSIPELKPACLNDVLENTLAYMRRRVSSKVVISTVYQTDGPVNLQLCVPLFEWVCENLCKNAVDAMEGRGSITVNISQQENKICLDFTDTGKGIPKSKFKTVFQPGFTTKKRGWGLGLSLVKRIIEDYHHGVIFVKQSELGKGTTFRILLNMSSDNE
ncbi:MAG: HAMP domain-containing histidine kinase [Paludibacteraceae bacterium]|nr:HAMP domain-containing histidine kinase [Paludibacteraceae bacterium]